MCDHTRFHPDDTFFEQNALEDAPDVFGVLGRDNVICDDEDLDAELEQPRRDGFHDCRLARAYGATYASLAHGSGQASGDDGLSQLVRRCALRRMLASLNCAVLHLHKWMSCIYQLICAGS